MSARTGSDEPFDLLGAQRATWESALSTVEKIVLLALLDHWSKRESQPWPSVRRLCRWTSLGRTAVIVATKSLRARGVVLLAIPTQYGQTNRYDLSQVCSGVLPVRVANQSARRTSPPDGPNQSASRTTPVRQAAPKEPREGTQKEPRIARAATAARPGGKGEVESQSEHKALRAHYAAEYRRSKGVEHKLAKSQGGRYAKAAQELLDAFGLEESKAIVTRALGDPWQLNNGPELWQILSKANQFRGAVGAAQRGQRGWTPQNGADPERAEGWGKQNGQAAIGAA
jgi:hypothetical protein